MAKEESAKPRTRTVVELHLRDITIQTRRGPTTSIMPQTDSGSGVTMIADLDARTINVKIKDRGTMIIPFENTKYFYYGMGVPKAD